ncbi:10326_t:CDS:2, partial [Acaulospora morrowiae]
HDENDKPRTEIQEELKDIENDFAQLKNQVHRERIQELDKEIESINQGIHPEQILRMEEIDKKRLRRLEITALRKKYQELHCQKQHDEARYRADYQFMADIRVLRKQILEDLERQKYRL